MRRINRGLLRRWCLGASACALSLFPAQAQDRYLVPLGATDAEQALFEAATLAPSDTTRFEALLTALPKVTERNGIVVYLLDGDLAYTKAELQNVIYSVAVRRFGRSYHFRLRLPVRDPEILIVDESSSSGLLNVVPKRKRDLTFTIDFTSFAGSGLNTDEVTQLIDGAASDWETACEQSKCGLTIRHVQGGSNPTFAWRFDPARSEEGFAFFPEQWPTRDVVYLGGPFLSLSNEQRRRVVRHELGHVLGYRHAERSEKSPCRSLSDESIGREVGTPDSESIMHSPYCATKMTLPTNLSNLDRELHRIAYDLKSKKTP